VIRRLALAALLLVIVALPVRAQTVIADLTDYVIGITTGFTGTKVVMFGAIDGPGDIVLVVRGPTHDVTVRRKSRVAGIWVNTREMTFTDVPVFYAIASTRPLGDVTTAGTRTFHQLGLDNMRFGTKGRVRGDVAEFRAALLRTQQREGLFPETVGRIEVRAERLFRSTITFPANVPTGTYSVEVLLLRQGEVVSAQTIPLNVTKVGVDAEVYNFADRQAAIYGIVAVLMAMMAGWLASLPFRSA
jgi:uncharacterized protein (TIGR02186 family)